MRKLRLNKSTLNPIFKETFTFRLYGYADETLQIKVYDYDAYKSDDLIGRRFIKLNSINPNEVVDEWYDLEDENGNTIKNGEKSGYGKIRIILQKLNHEPHGTAYYEGKNSEISKAIKAKEEELISNEEKIGIMENSFNVFDLEK